MNKQKLFAERQILVSFVPCKINIEVIHYKYTKVIRLFYHHAELAYLLLVKSLPNSQNAHCLERLPVRFTN